MELPTTTPAPVLGRVCAECRAFVSVLGRTQGILCGSPTCPFQKLNWSCPAPLPADRHHPTPPEDEE